jgi:hypothetical protein
MTVAELIAAGGQIECFRYEIKLRAASRCHWGWSPSSASARLIRNLEEAARAKGGRLATVKAATEGEVNSERLLTARRRPAANAARSAAKCVESRPLRDRNRMSRLRRIQTFAPIGAWSARAPEPTFKPG